MTFHQIVNDRTVTVECLIESSVCFFFRPGRIFVTSTCDLFVAETSASTPTAILEQDVNFAAYTNTHGLNFSQQKPENLRCLVRVTDKSDLKSDLTPSPPPPPPPASRHSPSTRF